MLLSRAIYSLRSLYNTLPH
uniref:Uncharacterized protein n=1 Tax=Anguilla anguilla TaxID=7936 RepID=A0A0E9RDK2_ANGAN